MKETNKELAAGVTSSRIFVVVVKCIFKKAVFSKYHYFVRITATYTEEMCMCIVLSL